MNKLGTTAIATLVSLSFAAEAAATEWNVSVWGKRRAFTEHVEKLAELVSEKTNGEFTMNVSYGGLSKNRENLDGISIGAFEMAQFCAGYHRDKNRVITVLELPFLGVENLEQEVAVSAAVYAHPPLPRKWRSGAPSADDLAYAPVQSGRVQAIRARPSLISKACACVRRAASVRPSNRWAAFRLL